MRYSKELYINERMIFAKNRWQVGFLYCLFPKHFNHLGNHKEVDRYLGYIVSFSAYGGEFFPSTSVCKKYEIKTGGGTQVKLSSKQRTLDNL